MIMEASVQEALFYITAGLCTLLAILVSYRWLTRQPEKSAAEEKEGEKRRERSEETKESEEEEELKAVRQQIP